ncbi:PAS domain S-box protein [Bordetella sp. BOR01]|uniref:helix-turn-helix transcriptional regulator n=1 Tax=Bordetella sp. BOR01 TaxID=2854779 RepID=UPI001C48ECDE|nr:PAS domain S-box protein [Bordetella sp. BOR01]MBV7482449.1 PAS domain S-box protein [Bordetella sp. BOR01]
MHKASVFTAEGRHLLEIIDGMIEGVILLDPSRHIVWANGTALAMHGVSDLAGLGGTAAGYRKRFALRYLNRRALTARQYPLDRALAGETFTDVFVELQRRTRHEPHSRVLQVRSQVVVDGGAHLGMVVVMLDVTERYNAEERFERTFAANPAPALICRLADLQYVKVNQGFLEMTGYRHDEIVGRTLYQIDVLDSMPDRDAAIAQLHDGATIPQCETLLRTCDGGSKLVVIAGQPIPVDDAPCMLFTFNDLETRRRAEDALRKSEVRFSKAFRLAPVPMTLSTPEGILIEVNEAFTAITGYQPDEVIGHADGLARLWVDEEAYRSVAASLADGKGVRNIEMLLRDRDGGMLDCLASADLVDIQDQRCVLGVIQDITERKRSEVELIAAIETVMQDTSWFSRTVIEKLAQIRQPRRVVHGSGELSDLTPREREVLGLICQGLSDADIAANLGLSRNTVRNHVATLYGKIDVHRRSAAIIWARERGIVGNERSARRPAGFRDQDA